MNQMEITKKNLYEFYQKEGLVPTQSNCYEHSHHSKTRLREIRSMMKDYIKGHRVLDLGCSEGVISKWIAESGASLVVGVDISMPKIERTPKLGNAIFMQGDWENLPFKRKSFSVVLLAEGLEHALHPDVLIKECMRVSDRIVITVPINETVRENPLTREGNGHLHTFNKEFIEKLSEKYRIEFYKEDSTHAYVIITDDNAR